LAAAAAQAAAAAAQAAQAQAAQAQAAAAQAAAQAAQAALLRQRQPEVQLEVQARLLLGAPTSTSPTMAGCTLRR